MRCTVLGLDEFDTVFNDSNIDGVIIGTPTDTHEELCIRALEANKHVLCEKPLAMTIKSSIRVINLAKERGLVLLVAFNRYKISSNCHHNVSLFVKTLLSPNA